LVEGSGSIDFRKNNAQDGQTEINYMWPDKSKGWTNETNRHLKDTDIAMTPMGE
jgi:hypothetical protein